ncbi:tetratricopeptide domain-containing protein [Fictibacillus macauensis ZFHKF-1]|uniref:Tetratricopeptide domain-containing protein n=1 Tax=Fictibacillus macauensis ZFHKF-1 TaxID=1196324 RepID=I8UAQ2_9BACL|nr:RapH N-terminal domain-containing protein [Fictibacillus macauensis]EIT83888.1 tetratricopeptide domain-containing protein [Fictibacillus macauensis ZFHKF-1]
MGIETLSKEQTLWPLLSNWYFEIRVRDFTKAGQLKDEIDDRLRTMEIAHNKTLFMYYTLLEFRYQLLLENMEVASQLLETIETLQATETFLSYYYHFFKAIYEMMLENYDEAHQQFDRAKVLLMKLPEEEGDDRAEFYYKVAGYYYQINQPLLALHSASKAADLFETENVEILKAGCENIMGLACVMLKEYAQAEEHFFSGLDLVIKHNDQELVSWFRFNLGFLYSEQNLLPAAIRHLSEVYQHQFRPHKTAYLLALSHYKMGDKEYAEQLIDEGLIHCSQNSSDEYKHHLLLLRMFRSKISESTLLEALQYFEKEELWAFIQQYAEEAAIYYLKTDKERSCHYFEIAYDAKQKIIEKGALK